VDGKFMKRLLLTCTLSVGFVAICGCGSKPAESPAVAETPAKAPRADLLQIPAALNKPVDTIVGQAYLDIVNDAVANPSDSQQHVFHAKSNSSMWFRGWAYDSLDQKVPDRVYIQLTNQASGLKLFIPANRMKRQDVATGFKLPWAAMCGFASAELIDHNTPKGTYDVKIYQIDDQNAMLTKYYETSAVTLIVE
jgi:hypothetical protein